MAEIMDLARDLGKAMAQSNQAAKLRAARAELGKHPDLLQTMQTYEEQADKMAQAEAENKPIEVEDKRRLEALHGKLVGSDVFKRYTSAQVEYIDLLRRVNEALRSELSATEG